MREKMKPIHRILIDETESPSGLEVITRFRSFSEIRTGILNTIEKLTLLHKDSTIYYKHPSESFTKLVQRRYPHIFKYNQEDVDLVIKPEGFLPWELFTKIPALIEEDLKVFLEIKKWKEKFKVKSNNYYIHGKSKNLFIHPSAVVFPNVVFDVTSGPIIIGKNVRITPFSYIEGPTFIANYSSIDNARITGGCIIGQTCRIGGEVENSIIESYTNKHHEGFLGHSYLGSWVNMGALATTSDLKNNYSIVDISIGTKKISTETIKFGSIIGDFSKIAIGVMLNTGTVIDVCSNIIKKEANGYIPPFTWIKPYNKYRLDTLLQDSKRIMARRNVEMLEEEEILIKQLYENY